MTRFIATLVLLTAMVLTPVLALAEDTKLHRTISISGRGEVSAIPDIVDISMGVSSSAKRAGDALNANTAAMKALFTLLRDMGIPDKDIATSNVSVNPRLDFGREGNQPPKIVGYDVSNTLTVRLRNVEKLGELIDKAVDNGTNQINGLSFSVSEMDKKLDVARKEAIADARRKAEVYAAAGGFSLGKVISVSEGGGYVLPRPYMDRNLANTAEGAVPIAQGEQQLSVDVSVVWELK